MNATMRTTAQKGSVLIVSLIILLVLTMIGVTAMGTSSLEEKMAGNSRDRELAFQAAEAALTDAQTFLEGIVATGGFTNVGGLYALTTSPDIQATSTWNATNSRAYSSTLAMPNLATQPMPNLATQPRYIIELRPTVEGSSDPSLNGGGNSAQAITMFRITARGTGGTNTAVVILQAFYGKIL